MLSVRLAEGKKEGVCMDGFLNILKPPGMTSGDMVLQVRRLLPKGTRVGHGGTLDPDAAGVLPICVGRAARLFDYIIDKQKTYIAELRLGCVTDTQDAGGSVLERHDASAVTEADVRSVLPRFTGEIDQIPPMYSALKRGGQKLCDLARQGESLDLEPRRVTVHAIDYLGQRDETAHLLSVRCGRGVYIRTLCHDIGAALGVGGHMAFLLRSEAGCFDVQHAATLEEMRASAEEGHLEQLIYPMDAPLGHLRALYLDERWTKSVTNGCAIRSGVSFCAGEIARIYLNGDFAGIAQADEDGLLRFKAMLLERNKC